MIQYLYESEHAPGLPADMTLSELLRAGVLPITTSKPAGRNFHYMFPHTCSYDNQECGRKRVCPHHDCWTCNSSCLRFICKICTAPATPASDASQLLHDAKLYEIADKYDIAGLKALSREKFARACRTYWKDDVFSVAAEHALMSTPEDDEGLREVLQEMLVLEPEPLNSPDINELLNKHVGFAAGLVKKQASEVKKLKEKK